MLAAGFAIVAKTKAAADSGEVIRSRFKMAVVMKLPHLARCDGKRNAAEQRPFVITEGEGDFSKGGVNCVRRFHIVYWVAVVEESEG